MDTIQELLNGYRRFYKRYFLSENDSLYRLLADGQSPTILFIGCSDSRVDPAILTEAGPGDIFVIRNVANLVPEYQPEWSTYHGVSAAIEFAVCGLNVRNVIVMGHTDCGGVKSLLDSDHNKTDNFIDTWLSIASSVKEEVSTLNTKGQCKYSAAEQLIIKLSLRNLLTFPHIRSRVKAGALKLHGWHFSVRTGELKVYDHLKDVFHTVTI